MYANIDLIFTKLKEANFKVATDTRKDVSGRIFFALKGGNFDGNKFAAKALKLGARAAVVDDPEVSGENIHLVKDVLETLQAAANLYRKQFSIPIIAIGGSNGKTTSKELIRALLQTKFKAHSTTENLNNHIGVPLSILSMDKDTEIGLFEIGANHRGEHSLLLQILEPTVVVVTNNGLDHLEGFGSPEGVRAANKEIYDWARRSEALAFVNKSQTDLMEDSKDLKRVIYPQEELEIAATLPLKIKYRDSLYTTNLAGGYNLENIYLALGIGNYFDINTKAGLEAIQQYTPLKTRSNLIVQGETRFIMDCYNANPSSMMLALENFIQSAQTPRSVILGDMLELGNYSKKEHRNIIQWLKDKKIDFVVLIGAQFKEAMDTKPDNFHWFENSLKAKEWLQGQNLKGYSILLKGSRGIEVEKTIGL